MSAQWRLLRLKSKQGNHDSVHLDGDISRSRGSEGVGWDAGLTDPVHREEAFT
jgi:hypothetical protein